MATLGEMADICRSKNAGPFLLTVDFLFRDKAKYEAVKTSNTLQAEEIATLYHVKQEQVEIHYFDAVKALKITMPRIHSCGSRYDSDVFGAQQHTPLMNLEFK